MSIAFFPIVNDKEFFYINIFKGMYILKKAGIISHQELIKSLVPYIYHLVKYTPGLWKHDMKDTLFLLVVDEFSIKYTLLDNTQHLLNALKTKYTISEDWQAQLYISITFNGITANKRSICQFPAMLPPPSSNSATSNAPNNPQPSLPHPHSQPTFGAKVEYATPADDSPILPDEHLKYIQQVIDVFLHYGISINNTILVGLCDIAAK